MFSGSRNSFTDGAWDADVLDDREDRDDGDALDDDARRFGFWGLRDMRVLAFLETAQTGVRTVTVRTPASGYASGD